MKLIFSEIKKSGLSYILFKWTVDPEGFDGDIFICGDIIIKLEEGRDYKNILYYCLDNPYLNKYDTNYRFKPIDPGIKVINMSINTYNIKEPTDIVVIKVYEPRPEFVNDIAEAVTHELSNLLINTMRSYEKHEEIVIV